MGDDNIPQLLNMKAFQKAINDIFKDKNFLEDCFIDGMLYKCICSSIEDGVVYGDAGLIDDVGFTLSLNLPLQHIPKIGQKVKFRDSSYKISNVVYDSANTSIALNLQSLSKG